MDPGVWAEEHREGRSDRGLLCPTVNKKQRQKGREVARLRHNTPEGRLGADISETSVSVPILMEFLHIRAFP